MNMLVCVKQVPDTTEIKIDPVKNTLIRDGVPSILNPFDGYALEAAARIKDKDPSAKIVVLSMGPEQAKAVLKESLAIAADKAYLVSDRAFGGSDTLATSYSILSAAGTQGSYDMIFCGRESLDGATGQMGAQLAERFEMAQVTSTLLIKEVDEENGTVIVDRALDNGTETLEVKLPCLFTIEKTNYPARIPNLKGKMAAKKAEIIKITSEDIPGLDKRRIGDPGSPTKVPRMFPPVLPEPGQIIDGADTKDKVSKLLKLIGR